MSHDPNTLDPSSTTARVERLLAEAEILLVKAAEEGGPVTVFAQHLPSGTRSSALRGADVTDEGSGLVREVRELVDPARPLDAFLSDPAASLTHHAGRNDRIPWIRSRTNEERALDLLMADLCDVADRRARGRLVLACARLAGGTDGHPTAQSQLAALEAWVEAPTPMAREAMQKLLDDTPSSSDPGQDSSIAVNLVDLALRSVLQADEGRYAELGHERSPAWSGPEAARRAVVCCHKVMVDREGPPLARARDLVAAMRDALG
ncbi:MAG: hypothetical protein KC621_10460 [Myxococcales bacterium]|nr:hypothetical protein [Myxococcales bacterium]